MEDLKAEYEEAFNMGDLTQCISIVGLARRKKNKLDVDLQRLENAVVKSNNPLFAFYYVRILKPADKKPFESVILKEGNAGLATLFARENPNECDVKAIEEIVLKNGDALDSANLVCSVDGCSVEKHLNKIIDECEPRACYLFAKKFQPVGEDLKRLQDVVIASKDAEVAYLFARDIYLADKVKLGKVALEDGQVESAIDFATLLIAECEKEMRNRKESGAFDFSSLIDLLVGSPIASYTKLRVELENKIREYGTYEDITDYIAYVKGADVTGMQGIIENSPRTDLKLEVATSEDADLVSLANSIIKDRPTPKYNVNLPEDLKSKE